MVTCQYCNNVAQLVSGKEVYPSRSDLWFKKFYSCRPCGAYVGCYPNSDKPLGILADAELRMWKQKAHAAFDPLWRDKHLSRSAAYRNLSRYMNLPAEKTHIGMFVVQQCQQVIEFSSQAMLDVADDEWHTSWESHAFGASG